MSPTHDFAVTVEWRGNRGTGTAQRRGFGRESLARADGVPDLATSAARVFHGDADRWNPEQLLMASLAQCHLLSYLYLCARDGVSVETYTDHAEGRLELRGETGAFTEVVLRPVVTVSTPDLDLAARLHDEAHELCFIANSVNFPVRVEPVVRAGPAQSSGTGLEEDSAS